MNGGTASEDWGIVSKADTICSLTNIFVLCDFSKVLISNNTGFWHFIESE